MFAIGEAEAEVPSPLPGDKTALVAPEAGWSQVSGMVIGCSAAALLILALVSACTFILKPYLGRLFFSISVKYIFVAEVPKSSQ